MNENKDAFGWNDEVEEGGGFTVLPEGPAAFTVVDFARERKEYKTLGEINVAVVTLHCVCDDEGVEGAVVCNLALHRKVQFKLFQFFTAIGQRKHGEGMLKPDWTKVKGASGRCVLGVREWERRDGGKGYSNEVTRFLDPEADESGFAF